MNDFVCVCVCVCVCERVCVRLSSIHSSVALSATTITNYLYWTEFAQISVVHICPLPSWCRFWFLFPLVAFFISHIAFSVVLLFRYFGALPNCQECASFSLFDRFSHEPLSNLDLLGGTRIVLVTIVTYAWLRGGSAWNNFCGMFGIQFCSTPIHLSPPVIPRMVST
jgi:hypothetical protein